MPHTCVCLFLNFILVQFSGSECQILDRHAVPFALHRILSGKEREKALCMCSAGEVTSFLSHLMFCFILFRAQCRPDNINSFPTSETTMTRSLRLEHISSRKTFLQVPQYCQVKVPIKKCMVYHSAGCIMLFKYSLFLWFSVI